MDAIDRRRSIRRFSDKEIPHEVICKIVESGIKAPSAKNRQPWKFMVIQGQAKENMLRRFRPESSGRRQEKPCCRTAAGTWEARSTRYKSWNRRLWSYLS